MFIKSAINYICYFVSHNQGLELRINSVLVLVLVLDHWYWYWYLLVEYLIQYWQMCMLQVWVDSSKV